MILFQLNLGSMPTPYPLSIWTRFETRFATMFARFDPRHVNRKNILDQVRNVSSTRKESFVVNFVVLLGLSIDKAYD